jgi:hypothetical protein
MRKIKLLMFALVAVMALGAMAAASASATALPLFLTESGAKLLFTALGGLAILRGKKIGQEAEIHCEESTAHGFVLNKTSLADEVQISFSNKCVENAAALGLKNAACKEPIVVKESKGELGLIGTTEVGLLLAPVTGTEFAKTECGGSSTTVSGAIIGTFPETGKYGKLEAKAELLFKATGAKQEPTSIELLDNLMTGVTLKVSEIFGEEASEATKSTITGDGKIAIDL